MVENTDTPAVPILSESKPMDNLQNPLETESSGVGILSLKRRQSDSSDTDSKRRRLSTVVSAPPKRDVTDQIQETRRHTGRIEERKRGQRLFGALLGTLSQANSSVAQRKRADIEKRQQDKLKQQDEEDSARRKERLAELQVMRQQEQEKFDGRRIRLCHATLIQAAGFLQTVAGPKLYYKPWELTLEQEIQIKRQVDDAHKKLEQELDEDQKDREVYNTKASIGERAMNPIEDATEMTQVGTSLTEIASDTATITRDADDSTGLVSMDMTAESAEDLESVEDTAENGGKDVIEEGQGELVIEADEDTAIY